MRTPAAAATGRHRPPPAAAGAWRRGHRLRAEMLPGLLPGPIAGLIAGLIAGKPAHPGQGAVGAGEV